MKKLFTMSFGSKLYGTSTPSSDIDLKTIYLPDLGDLLIGEQPSIFKKRDSLEHECTQPGEVEEEWIPIQTFAQHFFSSQSYALEISHAYKQGLIEFVDEDYKGLIDNFINCLIKFFSHRNIDSIIGYSLSQSLKYGLKGERLDAINKLIEHVDVTLAAYPKSIIEDIAYELYGMNSDKPIFITQIPETRANTTQPALSIGNKLFAFNTTLKHFAKGLRILRDKYGERSKKSLDGNDWKAISHAIRIMLQGIELLTTGLMTFPSKSKDLLLSIKNGEMPEDEAYEKLHSLFLKLKEAQVSTKLPAQTEELKKDFKSFLRMQMKMFYNI